MNKYLEEGEKMDETDLSKNLSEEVLDIYLDGYIDSAGVCKCPNCRVDIKALTLNNLPPRYVVTTKGDIFVRVSAMSIQAQADILGAVMHAIDIVSKNPRHSE